MKINKAIYLRFINLLFIRFHWFHLRSVDYQENRSIKKGKNKRKRKWAIEKDVCICKITTKIKNQVIYYHLGYFKDNFFMRDLSVTEAGTKKSFLFKQN